MAELNEVRIRVRSSALDLVEFTVDKMRQVTGLNRASIRTELSRMKRQGFLTSTPLSGEGYERGAPPHLYRLTDDDDKLDELARSVEAFYRPTDSAGTKPSSLYYAAASRLLDQLEAGGVPSPERLVAEVLDHLEVATADEGVGIRQDDEIEVIAAYLDVLHARLALIQGEWSEAGRRLATARSVFEAHRLDDGLEMTSTLANALDVERALTTSPDATSLIETVLALPADRHGNLPLSTVRRLFKRVRAPATSDASSPHSHPIHIGDPIQFKDSARYESARRLLDMATTARGPLLTSLLDAARRDLDVAEQAEGREQFPVHLEVLLLYERARLAYLEGEYEEAQRRFAALRTISATHYAEEMIRQINEFQVCLEAHRQFASRGQGEADRSIQARIAIEVLDEGSYHTNSPLIALLIELMRELLQTEGRAISKKVTVYLEDLIGLERELGKKPLPLVLEDDDFEEFLESCGLDEKARIVLFLALQYGLRPKDISSVLGLEEKEATSILHQAQRKVLAMIIDGAGLAVIEQQVVTGLARKKRPKTEIERTLGLERGELEAVLTSAKPKIADHIVHYS